MSTLLLWQQGLFIEVNGKKVKFRTKKEKKLLSFTSNFHLYGFVEEIREFADELMNYKDLNVVERNEN